MWNVPIEALGRALLGVDHRTGRVRTTDSNAPSSNTSSIGSKP